MMLLHYFAHVILSLPTRSVYVFFFKTIFKFCAGESWMLEAKTAAS